MDFLKLREFMNHLTAWRMPGNTISVYCDHKEVFRYSSGYSDIENGIKMNGDEILNIYSCTKVSTVTAALQLYEKGKFLLDDPLYEYISEYRNMKVKTEDGSLTEAKNPITLRHLFTMTAGLTYNLESNGIKRARKLTNGKMDTITVARCIADDPLVFEPGTHWNYSLCHDVLAAVVEVISGQKFSDYVKKNIFEPIGVKEIYYHRNDDIKKKMAQQYRFETDEKDLVKAQISSGGSDGTVVNIGQDVSLVFGENYDSGGAGISVSVPEYAKFADMLANGGIAANGERILSSGTVELMKTNQLTLEQIKNYNWSQLKGYGYGLGVRTMTDRAKSGSIGSIGEFGWAGAAGSTLLADTEKKLSFFYAHHMLNPQEDYYLPRLRNVVYGCMG